MSEAPLLGRKVGNYLVSSRLGAGGMGVVYQLRHQHLPNTLAALKVLKSSTADLPYFKQRFVQEALVAAAVGSDRVIRPIDIGKLDDGAPYIVFEFAAGRTLAQEVAARGVLPVEVAARLLCRIAETMTIVHARGIVHRDLKPSNLMLDGDAGDPQVKILDFGVARPPPSLRLAETIEHAIVGSPGFMSPEAASGGRIDAHSDVYSLGATTYWSLTGTTPFSDTGLTELLTQTAPAIADRRPPGNDDVPPELASLIARMLARDPADRPTMVEVYETAAPLAGVGNKPAPPPRSSRVPLDADDVVASTITAASGPVIDLEAIRRRLEQVVEVKLPTARLAGKRSRWWWGAVGGTAVIALVAFIALRPGPEPEPKPEPKPEEPLRVELKRESYEPPESVISGVALAPDGKRLATVATRGIAEHTVHVVDPGGGERDISVPGAPNVVRWLSEATLVLATMDSKIYLVPIDGGRATPLADGDMPAVSHSREQVAYAYGGSLFVIPARGGKPQLVRKRANHDAQTPTWSPDDDHIAFIEDSAIVVTDLEGHSAVVIESNETLQGYANKSLLWRNGHLIYPTFKEAGSSLWALAVDGDGRPTGASRRIYKFLDQHVEDLDASATRVVCVLMQTATAVWSGRLDRHSLVDFKQLTTGAAPPWPVGFTPDGTSFVVFEQREAAFRLVRYGLNGHRANEVTLGTILDRTWVDLDGSGTRARYWTRDGLSEAVLADGVIAPASYGNTALNMKPRVQCAGDVCVLSETDVAANELSFFRFDPKTGKRGPPIGRATIDTTYEVQLDPWTLSPTGDRIAVGQNGVQLIELRDASTRTLTFPGMVPQHLTFTPDGRELIVTSRGPNGGDSKLLRTSLDGTSEVLWSSPTVWIGHPRLTKDGQRIAAFIRTVNSDAYMIDGL